MYLMVDFMLVLVAQVLGDDHIRAGRFPVDVE
jgi:hypothetical protein